MNDFFLFFTIIILTLAGALAIEFGARELLRITNKKPRIHPGIAPTGFVWRWDKPSGLWRMQA